MLSTPAAIVRGYDVLVSAGHEGRPQSCARFPAHRCNLGAAGERAWTPIVADAVAAILRAHGVRVVRLPADYAGTYVVRAAIFIHFDGAIPACSSAASVGYPSQRDRAAAASWKRLYGRYFPFGFRPDNFTVGLRRYYAFKQTRAKNGAFVIELGEITCPAQRAWMRPRLHWEGALLAYWLSRLVHRGRVPLPAEPVSSAR
ncbi:MAG: hypothetical protein ACREMP_06095 [Candidatus Tyrphobacter sp.]